MTWLVVAAIVAAVVIQFELFLRSRGYQPSVKDDEYAWSWERMRTDAPRTVAILGSSRMMIGFSPDAFRAELPDWQYVQLAINGTTPAGSLLDLARDESFRGIAIIDMGELGFYQWSRTSQDQYIATYHRRHRAIGAMAERWLATKVQSRLAILATRGWIMFGKWLETREWPKPPYVTTRADRTRHADFSVSDVARERRARVERLADWERVARDPVPFLEEAAGLEPAIAAIQARGGNVVYVRMPTCDERWVADETMTPKAMFWDALATRSKAVMIHFKDYPELQFECPDTSHIDSKDAPAFTRSLLKILRAKGVLGTGGR